MIMVEKQNNKKKASLVMLITSGLLILTGFLVTGRQDQAVLPVQQNNEVLPLQIPAVSMPEVVAEPYRVPVTQVGYFFDPSLSDEHISKAITEFEGVYRPNQGSDYAFEGKMFEACAMVEGTVQRVEDDPLFGKSVTVLSGDDLSITYQSLSRVEVQQGQQVKAHQVLGLAGENIYNKDLGIHLHVAVKKNGNLIDPASAIGKKPAEIK